MANKELLLYDDVVAIVDGSFSVSSNGVLLRDIGLVSVLLKDCDE